MTNETKRCKQCGEPKPLASFGPRPQSRDGFHARCRDCMTLARKRYQAAHPEIYTAIRKRYAQNHPEKMRAQKRLHYARHAEERKAAVREYGQAHIERKRIWRIVSEAKRRAAKGGVPLNCAVTASAVSRLFSLFENLCGWCKKAKAEHLDHIQPLSKGGKHELNNLVPACASCNNHKHAKDPQDWATACGANLEALLAMVSSVTASSQEKM